MTGIEAEHGNADMNGDRSKAEHLADYREQIEAQRDVAREKQAGRGKRSAYDRVIALLDDGSFAELDPFVRHRATQFEMEKSQPFGDGIVTG